MAHYSGKIRSAVPKTYVSTPEIEMAMFEDPPADASPIVGELQSEISAARRGGRALAIALIQLEMLGVDATRDHERKATRRLLQIVSKILRHTDKCGLLADQEILAILPGADEAGCKIAMNRMLGGSFDKIAASLKVDARVSIAELGAEESGVLAFLDRVRGGEDEEALKQSA